MDNWTKGKGGTKGVLSWRRYIPFALVLFFGALLSVLSFVTVKHWELDRIQMELERRAGNMTKTIEKGIARNLEVLHAIGNLYAASREVERQDFRAFVTRYISYYPEIQALEWIPRVRDSEREAYEEAARKDGFADFQITQQKNQGNMVRATRRLEYFPVYYVEPLKGNEAALGFDLASNPTRLEALKRARDW